MRLTAGRKTRRSITGTAAIRRVNDRRREESARRAPARMIYDAVAGMLPKTKLGKHMLRKLRVYPATSTPPGPDPGALSLPS